MFNIFKIYGKYFDNIYNMICNNFLYSTIHGKYMEKNIQNIWKIYG